MNIYVDTTAKTLRIGAHVFPCAIGKNGVVPYEAGREGDGKTPLGTYKLRYGFYRADRVELPTTALPFWPLSQDDGWCDAPSDPAYNMPVRLPYPASAENLWRDSHVYDVIIVLGHNDSPPQPELGSAIFLHIAREGYGPTQGCVAVSRADMLVLVQALETQNTISISENCLILSTFQKCIQ